MTFSRLVFCFTFSFVTLDVCLLFMLVIAMRHLLAFGNLEENMLGFGVVDKSVYPLLSARVGLVWFYKIKTKATQYLMRQRTSLLALLGTKKRYVAG
ncbi:hypothetical protein L6452_22013 [Arctium lappa]|uniref:Uncharacterized protein n=1 Tax=Arctium lappa TaxID=4217 RepID=A0ACB9AYW0_ARCLA|nr:hypothetical protein L6452_22013 [Arctium lappa]